MRGLQTISLTVLALIMALGILPLGMGCKGDDAVKSSSAKPRNSREPATIDIARARRFIARYAEIAGRGYARAVLRSKAFQRAVERFAKNPTPAGLERARAAWIDAHLPYGRTEVFRFKGGPIDGTNGLAERINGWPIEAGIIDSVEGRPNSGIINNLSSVPDLTVAIIRSRSRRGGQRVLAGLHTIEFLLWGQDIAADGPGSRRHTDFIDGPRATAPNAKRRREYLIAVTELLVRDLQAVADAWQRNQPDNFRARFVGRPVRSALSDVFAGIVWLVGDELIQKRLSRAIEERTDAHELSRFSDITTRDFIESLHGVREVLQTGPDGPGLTELVGGSTARTIRADLDAATKALEGIPKPFDQAILTDAGRTQVNAAIKALEVLNTTIIKAAASIDIKI